MFKLTPKIQSRLTNLIVVVFFSLLTAWITFPLILNLTNKIVGVGDELLITWFLNWDIHALITNPISFFNANIFYPFTKTLAYSEIMLPSAILAMPFVLIFKEPILAFNINFLFGFIGTAMSMYLLIKYLTKNPLLGVIGGVILTFSTIHLNYLGHVQMFILTFIPLSILYLHKTIQSQRAADFAKFCLFAITAALNNSLGFFFMLLIFITFLIDAIFIKKIQFKKEFLKKSIFTGILSLLIVSPFLKAYLDIGSEFNYKRPITDSIHFALQFEDLLYPSNQTRLAPFLLDNLGFRVTDTNIKTTPGYPGAALLILGILALIWTVKNIKKNRGLIPFLLISVSSFVLSLGPALHLFRKTVHLPFVIPLPYALFYYLVPGFSGMRTPSRWIVLFFLSVVILIAFMFAAYFQNKKTGAKILIGALIIVSVLLEFNYPMNFQNIEKAAEFPKVYQWLATSKNQNEAIIELPLYNWDMAPYSMGEFKREYYSTIHFRKMVNGYSGFSPKVWEVQARLLMTDFPNEETISLLKKQKVGLLILHKDEYETLEKDNFRVQGKPAAKWSDITDFLNNRKDLEFITKFNDTYVYKLKN